MVWLSGGVSVRSPGKVGSPFFPPSVGSTSLDGARSSDGAALTAQPVSKDCGSPRPAPLSALIRTTQACPDPHRAPSACQDPHHSTDPHHPVPVQIRTMPHAEPPRACPDPRLSGAPFRFRLGIAHGALIQICANRGLPRSVPTDACPDPHHKALRFCWRIEDQLQSRRDQGLSPSHAFDDQSGRGGGAVGHLRTLG